MVRRVVSILALVLAATPVAADHGKTDIAIVDDGSIFIGEIESVEYATLNLDTNAAGLVSIEWRHVTGLTSKFEYRVELTGGVRHFGTLGPAIAPKRLSVVSSSGTIEVDFADVVEIVPIEQGFWKRLNGSANFGLTYTQANDALQYNLSGDVTYRTRKSYSTVSAYSIFNNQSGGESTNQHSAKLMVGQIAWKKWGAFELGQLQSNPDQGYDLRSIAGGGATNFLIEDSMKNLGLIMGAVYNREIVTGSSEVDNSVEALVGVGFRRFKRGSHSPSVQANLQSG